MGFSSFTDRAKIDSGPRSTTTFELPVVLPITLLSTAIPASCVRGRVHSTPATVRLTSTSGFSGGCTRMGLLDGKVAIVTGAGHGVGRGEALLFAKEGAKVVVNDLGGSVGGEGADKRAAEQVAEVIRDNGGEAVANYDDVSDWSGAKNLIGQAVEAYGKLDVLVNNAGILRDNMIFNMTEEDFDSVISVHLKGTFACT